MQSPPKKPIFTPIVAEVFDSEKARPLVGLPDLHKSPEPAAEEKAVDLYADEPILRENPNRFVLFPLKYHEV